jgi:hypothetical protein
MVHYTNLGDRDGKYPPQIIAALITAVHNATAVSLTTFYPTGMFNLASVVYTDQPAGSDGARGMWTWPERV